MKSYDKQRVLVTGAAGFVGSHLVDELLEKGATVVGVDNLLTGHEQNLSQAKKSSQFTFINADAISSPETYLPEDFIPNVVFHLASPASPPRYQHFPVETYLVNSIGTHNLLQFLLVKNQDARFVFASSSEIYGDPKESPQKESYWGHVNPNGIRSCYDEGKRFGETICGVHAREFGLDVRIARIFNTYGPRMDPQDGRVIPNFCMQALKNQSLTVYGDGTQTRSFCYVNDLVHGLLQLGIVDEAKAETINLGNSIEKTMLELAELVKTICHSQSTLTHTELPGDDPTQRRPDISKAETLLHWKPRIGLEDGLKQTIEYFQTA